MVPFNLYVLSQKPYCIAGNPTILISCHLLSEIISLYVFQDASRAIEILFLQMILIFN